jgi:co-chaperonin GroES (HSP10)
VSFGELCPKVDDKHTIEIGQEVLFDNYKASDLIIDGNHYKTFYYSDLVALI